MSQLTRRTALSLSAAALLSACAAPVDRTPDRVGDRKPVRFAGRQPTSYPVQGIDVARFQKEILWDKVAQTGNVRFAFIKSTEGGDLLDPKFKRNWRAAERAGITRGAYHFYYYCTEPEKHAEWFIRNVPRSAGALPPVLDMEWNPFSPTCTFRPPAAEVRRQMRVWMDIVGAHYGQRPIIYTTPDFYHDNGLDAFRGEDFWLRATARRPEEIYPGQPWRFWQYSSTGEMPGVLGDTDLNAFNGTEADWTAWLARRQVA